jgi:hypothetical protein
MNFGLLQRDQLARSDDVARVRLELAIRLDEQRPARVIAIAVRISLGDAIVINLPDGNERGQFRRAAEMVRVKMRGDVMVDLLQPGHVARGLVDAPRVAHARIAGIDQHRLARGRDNERAPAAFDIHPIDVERLPGLGRAKAIR